MNLTPEEKKIGKDNFNTVMSSEHTRRDFLKGAIAAGVASGAGLGAMWFGYGDAKAMGDPIRIGILGTGDEGGVLIGALNPDYVEVAAIADIRPYNRHRAFHGDYSSDNAIKHRPGLMAKYGWKTEDEARKHVRVYEDQYEQMFKDKDELGIEGVIIALPLHLHDVCAVQAMQHGLHVLTEKLMGHSVHQCKEMARVAQKTNSILATGHQRHYSILYDNAVDMMKRGLLGDIHYIRAQWHRGNLPGRDSWQPPLPPPEGYELRDFELEKRAHEQAMKELSGEDLIQKKKEYEDFLQRQQLYATLRSWRGRLNSVRGAEIDLWQKRVAQIENQIEDRIVNAADYGYQERTLQDGKGSKRTALEELIRWRLWDRTGGGLMAELGSHQLDAASIFISSQREDGEKVLPLSVSAVGGRHVFPADRDCDDHVYCIFEFPGKGYYKDFETKEVADENKKIVVTYSSINGNGWGGYGETVMGTEGTLLLEREKDVMLFSTSGASNRVQVKKTSSGPVLDTTESGAPAVAAAATSDGPVSRGYTEEIEHWAWCIREFDPKNAEDSPKPRCHPKVAMADAVIALTSNIAMDEGRKIEFKPEWFEIDSDETPEGVAPKKV